jgi:hypothetical protein
MLNSIVGIYAPQVAASTNSYESIATVTVGAGGQSSIDFTSIPSTYKHLQIRYSGFVANDAFIRFNSDTASNYSRHSLYGNGSTVAAFGAANQTAMGFTYTASATNPGAVICDVLDYADTNKYKTIRVLNGDDQNGSGIIMLASGSWRNTAAITSISIFEDSGVFGQYSSFALYGIKG